MTPATTPPPVHLPHLAFATAFEALMRQLLAIIGARFLKNPRLAPLILPLWARLSTAIRRMHATMARIARGRPARQRPPRPSSPRKTPRPKLPSGYAWLLRALKHEAVFIRLHLEALIATPEHAAIIAASPSAQRILNPIRHALGHDAPHLTRGLAPRPIRARPPKPRRERPPLPVTLLPQRPPRRKIA